MDLWDSKSDRDAATQLAKESAESAVLQLQSSQLQAIKAYMQILAENEMIRCSGQDGGIMLRRAQGKAAALATVIELLNYVE